jgi:hypothetical protein
MANRQDSGSSAAHQNQRPQNEDAMPEMNDDVRGRADEGDDEFEDTEDLDDLDDDDAELEDEE